MENEGNQQSQMANVYLNQVLAQKDQVERDLKVQRVAHRAREISKKTSFETEQNDGVSPYANNVRITGWWRFKNVIVPPNVYAIHTRRGYPEPLHIGIGMSFPFDPVMDSYLIVPATMQTILINANCICRERQGLVVQGYVQWIIDDIKTAYKKLDFSDSDDPMRIVNVQLREQAEASIKDKVATMGIDEVLTDKQPIIQELTARLRNVTEGEGQDKGLGVRIVTVQIKEAVVCSAQLWEMLQRPFRAERRKEARLAELANDVIIREKEEEAQKSSARLRIETDEEIAKLKDRAQAAMFDREQAEVLRRSIVEAKTLEETRAHEIAKLKYKAETDRLKEEEELMIRQMRLDTENKQAQKEMEFFTARRTVENEISPVLVQEHLVDHLSEIVEKFPVPSESKTISIGSAFPLVEIIAGLKSLLGTAAPKDTE